jgi:hypothetical protein
MTLYADKDSAVLAGGVMSVCHRSGSLGEPRYWCTLKIQLEQAPLEE